MALSGLKVIDASTMQAAPMAGVLLAEFGADVIKVEDPNKGDPVRRWGAQVDGEGLMWKSLGRNKRIVSIDLRDERGRDVFRRLVSTADVVIFNQRAKTLEKWGLTYESLSKNNPRLIQLTVSAFGRTGPYRDRPGFGTMAEGMSGFAAVNGFADGPPILPSFALADGVAAMNAAYALMVALYWRDAKGGRGQEIDVSLLEPLSRLLEYNVLEYSKTGYLAGREGSQWRWTAPRDVFKTNDDRWMAISASVESTYRKLFIAVGQEDLADELSGRPEERVRRHGELADVLREWFIKRSYEDICEIFERGDVSYSPIYSSEELLADPHVNERQMYKAYDDPGLGSLTVQEPTSHLSATPPSVRWLGRTPGADTYEILKEYGLTSEEVNELEVAGVIRGPEHN